MPESFDIYRAPDAALVEYRAETLDALPCMSTWLLLVLATVTLGLFPIWWLYSRSRVVNSLLPENPISSVYVVGVSMVYAVVIALGLAELQQRWGLSGQGSVLGFEDFALLTLVVAWGFQLRSRLLSLFAAAGAGQVPVGPLMTCLFTSLYLNYKINEARELAVALGDRRGHSVALPA